MGLKLDNYYCGNGGNEFWTYFWLGVHLECSLPEDRRWLTLAEPGQLDIFWSSFKEDCHQDNLGPAGSRPCYGRIRGSSRQPLAAVVPTFLHPPAARRHETQTAGHLDPNRPRPLSRQPTDLSKHGRTGQRRLWPLCQRGNQTESLRRPSERHLGRLGG